MNGSIVSVANANRRNTIGGGGPPGRPHRRAAALSLSPEHRCIPNGDADHPLIRWAWPQMTLKFRWVGVHAEPGPQRNRDPPQLNCRHDMGMVSGVVFA